MPTIEIHRAWCKNCYICVEICPCDVLSVDRATFEGGDHPVITERPDDCTVCRLCELLCPDLAIVVEKE